MKYHKTSGVIIRRIKEPDNSKHGPRGLEHLTFHKAKRELFVRWNWILQTIDKIYASSV